MFLSLSLSMPRLMAVVNLGTFNPGGHSISYMCCYVCTAIYCSNRIYLFTIMNAFIKWRTWVCALTKNLAELNPAFLKPILFRLISIDVWLIRQASGMVETTLNQHVPQRFNIHENEFIGESLWFNIGVIQFADFMFSLVCVCFFLFNDWDDDLHRLCSKHLHLPTRSGQVVI